MNRLEDIYHEMNDIEYQNRLNKQYDTTFDELLYYSWIDPTENDTNAGFEGGGQILPGSNDLPGETNNNSPHHLQ